MMGCDIHMFVDYSPWEYQGKPQWRSFAGRYNPGRDYHMFEILAGVRGDEEQMFDARGLPDDMSWEAAEYLNEDGDLHSHSWLTGDEYTQAYAARILSANQWGPPDIGYELVMVLVNACKERDVPVRVLFAFDN